jgi:hypothetical protein
MNGPEGKKSERNEQNRRLSPCTRRPPLPAQALGVQRTQKISGSRNRKNSQALRRVGQNAAASIEQNARSHRTSIKGDLAIGEPARTTIGQHERIPRNPPDRRVQGRRALLNLVTPSFDVSTIGNGLKLLTGR